MPSNLPSNSVNLDSVRRVVRFAGVTQNQIATSLGLHQQTIAQKLHGALQWKAHELMTVARLCNVSLDLFFGDVALVSASSAPTPTSIVATPDKGRKLSEGSQPGVIYPLFACEAADEQEAA
jgi:transcriptional regulator with XRE-family HTH domain